MILAPRYIPKLAAVIGLFTRYGLLDFANKQGLLALQTVDDANQPESSQSDDGTAKAFRKRLIQLGPAYIKLGQVLHGKSAAAGARKGAIWGGAILGAAGAVMAYNDPEFEGVTGITPREFAVASFVQGIAMGALIGVFVKAEKWESVSLQPSVGFGTGGMKVGFTVR